jgi:tetratricopeptide (TPR) repeat protein
MRATAGLVPLLVLGALRIQHPHPAPASQAIGTVRFATSCSAAAQPIFNRAVALLHSFAFSQAIERFNAVLGADPQCAMAWWGIAMSGWGNPFAAGIKPAAQIQRGLDAVNRARSTGAPTARESRYIEAAARLYEHADSVDQRTRLLAYRDAMAELAAAEPADTEATIFHALALAISADPADKTYASQLAAGATLERLSAGLPDHPGIAHYIIHSYDVPPLAGRALNAAGRYSHIAPAVSHALHMPSHTWTRVGNWQQSIDANVLSADAARREGSTAEELHSSDYRTYAYLQLGQDRAARRMLESLPAIAARLDPNAIGTAAPPSAGYFAIAAIPARYALERGAWAEAARLEVSPTRFPFAEAMTWFARGLGAARGGDTTIAGAAVTALQGLHDRLVQARETYWSEQVEIQRRGVQAWLDFAAGRRDEALAEMRAAADREDATEKNAITPGPLAPARELLGEMLLAAHQPAEALAAFETTLSHEPNRFRALAGAATAASGAGDRAKAAKYYAQLLKLGAHADRPGRPELLQAAKAMHQLR